MAGLLRDSFYGRDFKSERFYGRAFTRGALQLRQGFYGRVFTAAFTGEEGTRGLLRDSFYGRSFTGESFMAGL